MVVYGGTRTQVDMGGKTSTLCDGIEKKNMYAKKHVP